MHDCFKRDYSVQTTGNSAKNVKYPVVFTVFGCFKRDYSVQTTGNSAKNVKYPVNSAVHDCFKRDYSVKTTGKSTEKEKNPVVFSKNVLTQVVESHMKQTPQKRACRTRVESFEC